MPYNYTGFAQALNKTNSGVKLAITQNERRKN